MSELLWRFHWLPVCEFQQAYSIQRAGDSV